jgi:hypothetical protein
MLQQRSRFINAIGTCGSPASVVSSKSGIVICSSSDVVVGGTSLRLFCETITIGITAGSSSGGSKHHSSSSSSSAGDAPLPRRKIARAAQRKSQRWVSSSQRVIFITLVPHNCMLVLFLRSGGACSGLYNDTIDIGRVSATWPRQQQQFVL